MNISGLVKQYVDATISESDYLVLRSWVSASAENQKQFDRMREEILASELNEGELVFDDRRAFERFRDRIDSRRSRRRKAIRYSAVLGSVSALAVVAVLSVNFFRSAGPDPVQICRIDVPAGAHSDVVLPDGSEITLNAGTHLKYDSDFGVGNRDLWLEGEGYFIVRHSDIPFVVHSKKTSVTALGTEFNVRAYNVDDYVEATLVKGKIEVKTDVVTGEGVAVEKFILKPNEKIVIRDDNVEYEEVVSKEEPVSRPHMVENHSEVMNHIVEKVKVADVSSELAWRSGRLSMNGRKLKDIVPELENKYDVEITIADPEVAHIEYVGTFEKETVEQLMNILCEISPVRYKMEGRKITIYRK